MRRYNIVRASRILLILTVITFALAAPAPVQNKRRAYVDMVHVPEDVITVLRKRMDEEFEMWRLYEEVLKDQDPPAIHLPNLPPANPAKVLEVHAPPPNVQVPPPNPSEVHVPEVDAPPPGPADSDRESMELDDDLPPPSPEWF
jgi:hypothetical protein